MPDSGGNLNPQPLLRLQPTDPNEQNGPPVLLTDVLRSLHIPSETESAHIRSLVLQDQRTLEGIIQRISDLRTGIEDSRDWELISSISQSLYQRLSMLDCQRLLLLERIRQLKQLVSSVRRVPREVWERIISFNCQCDNPGSYRLVIGYFGRPVCEYHERIPLYPLCHTSYMWRTIAIRTPRYWSRYRIHLPCCRQNSLSLLKAHVERSQDNPLDIEIYGSLELCMKWSRLGNAVDAFRQVLPHLPRCERLVMDAEAFESVIDHGRHTPWSFQYLTSVSLGAGVASHTLSREVQHPFWAALSASPKLTIALTSTLLPTQCLPYPRLTTLSFTRLTADENGTLIQLLPTCTSLRNLAIGECTPFEPIQNHTVPEICHIERLTISLLTFPTDIIPLFQVLSFPSLHSLDMTLGPEGKLLVPSSEGSEDWTSHISHFKNSTPSLDSLTIRFQNSGHCTIRLLSVLPLLRALPDIARLDIRVLASQRDRHQRFEIAVGNTNNGNTLVHPITRLLSHFSIGAGNPTMTALCPRLEELTLVDEGFPIFQADDIVPLVDMVKSRNMSNVICHLTSFTMGYGIQPQGSTGMAGFIVEDTRVLRPGDAGRLRELKEIGIAFSREVLLPPSYETEQEHGKGNLRLGLGIVPDVAVRLKFRTAK